MIDPYAELKLTAQRMEADGVSPDLVVDALLCVGLNAANRLHGLKFVITHLRKLIEVFEEKAPEASATTHGTLRLMGRGSSLTYSWCSSRDAVGTQD